MMISTVAHLEIAGEKFPLRRFTSEDYMRMIESGVLGPSDRVELIDGMIVPMSPAGLRHNQIVVRLNRAFAPAWDRAVVTVQGTLLVGEKQVFDPDLMLLKPHEDDYGSRSPQPGDLLLLVEVADTSLARDRLVKRPIYAAGGVPEYWIIDLESNTLLRHTNPRGDTYAHVETFSREATIAAEAFSDLTISLRELLG